MATKFQSFLLFLLFLALHEMLIMPGEASYCETPSRLFTGLCIRKHNCGTICEKEGYLNGHCRLLKCICYRDCDGGGGPPSGGEGPPEGPPGGGEGPPEGPPGGGEGPPEGPPGGGEGPPEGGDEPPVESAN